MTTSAPLTIYQDLFHRFLLPIEKIKEGDEYFTRMGPIDQREEFLETNRWHWKPIPQGYWGLFYCAFLSKSKKRVRRPTCQPLPEGDY